MHRAYPSDEEYQTFSPAAEPTRIQNMMSSLLHFEHEELIRRSKALHLPPVEVDAYKKWIQADEHLNYLHADESEEELTTLEIGKYGSITTAVVKEERLSSLRQTDLLDWLDWHFRLPSTRASYEYSLNADDIQLGDDLQLVKDNHWWGCTTLDGANSLVYYRKTETDRHCDVLQEYVHLTGAYWSQERGAFRRLDKNGDWEHVISVTYPQKEMDFTLVSFKRKPLDEYLIATKSVLARLFDFTLLQKPQILKWPRIPSPNTVNGDRNFFFRHQIVSGKQSWTRGVQIIRPRLSREDVFASIGSKVEHEYEDFIALDWHNQKKAAIVSTDPKATANYFSRQPDSRPLEMSPAFFSPEVLQKFKNDREKYTVTSTRIICRNSWSIPYDVNKAHQVQVYIKDLRSLPFQEQTYWKSFNESVKGWMSERSIRRDFLGEWIYDITPLEEVMQILHSWHGEGTKWWKPINLDLFDQVHVPYTNTQDEWETEFLNLAKLVVEGFKPKAIRARLEDLSVSIDPDKKGKSLHLLDLLMSNNQDPDALKCLTGLVEIQKIRSRLSTHGSDKSGRALAERVLSDHQTFTKHFNWVCGHVLAELALIEQMLSVYEN